MGSELANSELRTNVGTWAVPSFDAPSVAAWMQGALPREEYDPDFAGQELQTYYLDTRGFGLRRARRKGQFYATVRLRSYQPSGWWALSVKTELGKWRSPIEALAAVKVLSGGGSVLGLLPAELSARVMALTVGEGPLLVVVCVGCRRYAVEDDVDRYSLDLGVCTDTGKRLGQGVLEHKSTAGGDAVGPPGLRPIKLSKFLWATDRG